MRSHAAPAGRGPARTGRGGGVRPRASRRAPGPYAPVAALQARAGNQAVAQLLARHPVARADAPAEREAAQGLRPSHATSGPAPVELAGSQGRPLEPPVRRDFERSLGTDLAAVRLHDDAAAHDLARAAGAKAATLGAHVYFSEGRFAPATAAGRELLAHELVHTLQPEARTLLHRSPESEARLAEIEEELGTSVISPDRRQVLEEEREELLSQGNTAVPAVVGTAARATPNPSWYYRLLSATDPTLEQIRRGADLLPRPPDPGFAFKPAPTPAEMTFRHMRAAGNVPQVGTNRISSGAELEAFRTILRGRGTELARVDVDLAQRLGAEFLARGDVMRHLDELGAKITADLAKARAEGRGAWHVARLESRLRSLEAARAYAQTFGEGQAVGRIPSRAVSPVKGRDLVRAVAGEKAVRGGLSAWKWGGRVFTGVGAVMSVDRIASAPEGERVRVVAEEAGGWAGSFAGAAGGAKAGAMLGGAFGIETGPGAVVTAAFGALVGSALGFFGGQEAVEELYDVAEVLPEAGQLMSDPVRYHETTLQMFGDPEDIRAYYEWREFETGEPPPWAEY